MASITFTIDDQKLSRVTDAIKGLFPIPQIPDPGDPNNTIDEFTANQWAKEYLRRYIRDTVARYETKVAKDAVAVAPDNDIAS